MLDSSQIISGVAVLLSFFVGYKYALKMHSGDSDEEESAAGSSSSTKGGTKKKSNTGMASAPPGNYKMVLVVRNDLKMGKGKIAAQCGHAAVGAFESASKTIPAVVRRWDNSGCAKIALKVESESELMDIRTKAIINGLNVCLIRDAGRTQIEPNTKTVLGVGPALDKDIDKVTGHLRLL